jgi:hypothetical protein
MGKAWSILVREAIRHMEDGDARRACDTIEALDTAERTLAVNDASTLAQLWKPFLRLLRQRGYFVDSDETVALALEQIQLRGTGFDLYDLAASLARYDTAQAKRLSSSGSRFLPALRMFFEENGPVSA